jgi:Uma2 family endonuclease
MATEAESLYTAEQYAALPDDGNRTELIRGRIIPLPIPTPRYGYVCSQLLRRLGGHAEKHRRGHVLARSAVITERDPDTVRGADVAYYSYSRVPPGPLPPGYLSVVPELVFEVRSPTDRWVRVLRKVTEYLDAGVTVVCVLDEVSETAHVYRADELPQTLHGDDELRLPDILGDFAVAVQRFFA